jgi:hypothetical protein
MFLALTPGPCSQPDLTPDPLHSLASLAYGSLTSLRERGEGHVSGPHPRPLSHCAVEGCTAGRPTGLKHQDKV